MSALADLVHNAVRVHDIDGTAYSYSLLTGMPYEEAKKIIINLVHTFKEKPHDNYHADRADRESTTSTPNTGK